MIYLDSSVALARVFAEHRRPPSSFWSRPITSSRLLACELWNRVHAHQLAERVGADLAMLLHGVVLVEMSQDSLARALHPFPLRVRTLDGLHLATMDYIRERGRTPTLASYDARLIAAAEAMGFATLQP